MKPGKYDLTIYCGTTVGPDSLVFTYKVDGTPVNITGYTAKATGTSMWDGRHLFDLSSASGTIVLGGALGTLALLLTAEQTAAMWRQNIPTTKTPSGAIAGEAGVWDLELTSPAGTVVRLLYGSVYLSPEVTRS